jgi:ABC-2 type transport system ATP-binding protein
MGTPLIRMGEVWKRYGRVEALSGASFEVPEGSVFALIGPNGAGKTTAIKAMLNLVSPSRGRAEVLGIDSRQLNAAAFQRIGYVSENQQLPEWMTVRYFLDYCREFYPSWNAEDAQSLTSALELPLNRRLSDLSRGMRVKTAIVSSLAFGPRLLILDEPFSGLDVLVRDQLTESILGREMTVFVASHDLSDLESFASHVAYLSEGRVLFVEELATLLSRFREVEITIETRVDLSRVPAGWRQVEQSPNLVRFVDTQFDEATIRRAFVNARDVQIRPMSLRSIFVALAKQAR